MVRGKLPRASRGGRRSLAAAACALLTVASAVVPTSAAAQPGNAQDPPQFDIVAGSETEPAAVDLISAGTAAEALGEPVEVAELTTETVRHLANPDGTYTFEAAATPQRTRAAGGGWARIDPTLRQVGDRIEPVATVLDMSLSAGGTDELIMLADGQRRLALSWPEPLPVPELVGDTARYRSVLPGVDLVVRAEPDSFTQALVVRSRAAADNPALGRIAWEVTVDGLTVALHDDGSIAALDEATGEVVFAAPPAVMWDSPAPPDPLELRLAEQTGERLVDGQDRGPGWVADMPVELTGAELAVLPDRQFLDSDQTTFPVWIDPSFSTAVTNWAPVFAAQPSTSWTSGTSQPRNEIRVGLLDWPGCGSWCGLWRSHLRFPISGLSGQQLIGNPTFRIRLEHSASCNATPVALWRTNAIPSGGATWNNMSGGWLTDFGTRSANANKGGGCSNSPQPDVNMEWSTSTMRSNLQARMDSATTHYTFGLRASNESDRNQWKRFERSSARLIATYNRPPLTPDRLAIDADCYLQCASPAVVRTLRPWLQARVRDPHSSPMRVEFEVRNSASSVVASGSVNNVNHGGTARWRPPSNLSQEGTFRFRVRASNEHLTSAWSGYFTFTVDTNPPATPTVSSSFYPDKDTGTWNGGVGQAGSFTFGPNGSSDVIEYRYRWLDGSESSVRVAKGASRTVDIAPPADMEQVLQVRSVDHAGNISGWRSYAFLVRPQPVDVAYWKFDEGQGTVTAPATGDGAYAGTLRGGAAWAASGLNPANPVASGSAIALDGHSGRVEMPRVLTTNHVAGFSVTAWVDPDSLSTSRTVVSQAGTNTYAFLLYYRASSDSWCFRITHADTVAAAHTEVCAARSPAADGWTHLAGVYDRPAGRIRLWVDGGPNNGEPVPGAVVETAAPTLWAGTGAFTIGSGLSGTLSGHWHGRIDEVRAHQRVLTEFELQHTFLQCRYANCPPVPEQTEPVLAGQWDMDEGTGPTTMDSSGLGNDATLTGGAQWTPDGYDDSPAVRFPTASSYLSTGSQVVVADQSFTISAWVRLESFTGGQQWVMQAQQAGGESSAYKLYYGPNTNSWRFAVASPNGSWVEAVATAGPVLGDWVHLVGIFDAAASEVRIYVDGQLDGSATGTVAHGVTTPLYLGGAPGGSFHLGGTLDSARAYQSALTGLQVSSLYREQVEPLRPAGQWDLTDGVGTTAPDSSGRGHHATLHGAIWDADGYAGMAAVALDGATAYLATAGPVVHTDRSFSVATWVRADTLDGYRTVLSQEGERVSAFRLRYTPEADRWCFTTYATDGASPSPRSACGPTVRPQQWTHLAGVYDAAAAELRLYVNGTLVGTRQNTTAAFRANGPFAIGRALHTWTTGATDNADFFPGSVQRTKAYDFALTAAQLSALFDEEVAAPDLVGAWGFDEGEGETAHDASGLANHASLAGGATWTTGSYAGEYAVHLNGVDGHLVTDGTVLATERSYTVAAWVRLDQLAQQQFLIRQTGAGGSSMVLWYDPAIGGRWRLTARSQQDGSINRVTSSSQAVAGAWTHVVGVYDAVAGELRIYVDGVREDSLIGISSQTSTSALAMGSSSWLAGTLDEVRVYQSALSDLQVAELFNGSLP